MTVEIRVLGDLELSIDGEIINVGPVRQRCVLAALVMDINNVVSVDHIIDRVWAEHSPKRARETLRSYLSRLRTLLNPARDVALERRAGGYLLAAAPTTVDACRFGQLIARAGAEKNDNEALRLWEEALQLWRGEAFAHLDTPWVVGIRSDLDRQRFGAELDRNDAGLRCGRHAQLLAALSGRARECPLDERLAGQLMLALYRCGRQVDALEHYRRVERRLAGELGIDPSRQLQDLRTAILRNDPGLSLGPSLEVRESPAQLPADLPGFTGRRDELARLDAGPASVAVVIVSGTAGVGKSALAVRWAHRVADRFPDGQLYVNLRGFDLTGSALEPAVALRGFLDALGVPADRVPTGLDAQSALYRSLLAGRRVLVVLDNARDVEQVRPLVPGSPGCLVLVTSRNQLAGLVTAYDALPVGLDLPSAAEARQLLIRRVGRHRVDADPAAAAEIVTRCARLPLALAIVAAHATIHPDLPLEAVAGRLREARPVLDAFDSGDPGTDVRAVLSWSQRTVSPAASRLFRLAGLHPGPDVTAAAAASLTGEPVGRVRPLLAELVRAHLLTEPARGRFTCHDLLRAYGTELAHAHESDDQRQAAVHRTLEHYLRTAHAAAGLLNPHRDPIVLAPAPPGVVPEVLSDHTQALAWFTAEYPVLLAAIRYAAGTGFDTHAWQLAWTMVTYCQRQGRWSDQVVLQLLALRAAGRRGDEAGQAHTHRDLASAYARLGELDEAGRHDQHAIDLFRGLGDHIGQAHTHVNLGYLHERQDQYEDALRHARQALDLYQWAGDRTGEARALTAVGWYRAHLGTYQQALTDCQRALILTHAAGDHRGQADAWDSLGYVHHGLGHHRQAIRCYHQALDLYQQAGDRHKEACTLTHLSHVHQVIDEPDTADQIQRRAEAILSQIGDHYQCAT